LFADRLDRGALGLIDKVSVALGGAKVFVSQRCTNRFQRLSGIDRERRIRMPEVMDTNIFDIRSFANSIPSELYF